MLTGSFSGETGQKFGEVIILGAGFSMALSSKMPSTDELGKRAAERACIPENRLPIRGFHAGNFERWLSLLGEDQPQRSLVQNLDCRRMFAELSAALVEVLWEAESEAIRALSNDPDSSDGVEHWLRDLLLLMHWRRAMAITLNYDTLIEAAVRTYPLPLGPLGQSATPNDVLDNYPVMGGVGGIVPPQCRRSTFQLLKLHGSIDWFVAYGDKTGATVQRVDAPSKMGYPAIEPAHRARAARGLAPFIVPPTVTKSSYYDNPVTSWIWQHAGQAIGMANRIALVGYSLPRGDLAMSAMVAEAIHSRSTVLEIVNPCPAPPGALLRELGADYLEVVSGDRCIERFVKMYCDRSAAAVVAEVRKILDRMDPELQVTWIAEQSGFQMLRQVEEIRPGRSDAELVLVPVPFGEHEKVGEGTRLSELLDQLRRAKRVVRLMAERPLLSSQLVPIVAAEWTSYAPEAALSLHALR